MTEMFDSRVNPKISLIVLITIGVVIIGVDAKRPRRIVGSENAENNEFPWMARLNITDGNGVNHDCGGAIISPRHILTAAHCLQNLVLNSVWTGYYIRDFNVAVESHPAQLIVHPDYNVYAIDGSAYNENDVGIVVLDEDLKLDVNQNSIPLTDEEPTIGTHAVLAGWGFTKETKEDRAMTLQKTPIIIQPEDQCPKKTPNQLCGLSLPHATPCNGDSGSPLVADGRVVGILSTGWCLVGRETMYVNVYHYLAWIRSTVEQTSA